MNFLSPALALYAAAAAIPLLGLLYFLKLRRQQRVISSTFLWKRAVQDLQVNAPFQRLRKNLLLLLQMLALVAALLALSRPVWLRDTGPAKRYVLLIDRSGSMNATDVAPSRLEAAKKAARQFVNDLRGGSAFALTDQADQVMVVAFDEHARTMCNFTADRKQLLAAIDAITPGDGSTRLEEAILVGKAHTAAPGEAANARAGDSNAHLELFSDGRFTAAAATASASLPGLPAPALAEGVTVLPGELTFHRIGQGSRNVAVVAMQARRGYENPQEVELFAGLANYGPEPVTCDVQLSVDGAIRAVQSAALPAEKDGTPGGLAVTFSLSMAQGGVLEVRCLSKPAQNELASDDAAWVVLPPPRNLAVCLVTPGNPPLLAALKACPLARLDVKTPAEFDAIDFASLPSESAYDVIVLDRHAPAKLPRGRFIVFGPPPPGSGAAVKEQLANQVVVDWRSGHPILQYVNMANVFAAKSQKLSLPPDSSVLAEFTSSPALALVRNQGSVFLLVPFDSLDTNWPFEPGFVLFCYNATAFLGLEGSDRQHLSLHVDQPLSLEGLPSGLAGKITGPSGQVQSVQASAAGALRFPGTDRVGLYHLSLPDRPEAPFAVNLLDADESRIQPADELVLGRQKIDAQPPGERANHELWPYLVLAALAGILLEWWVYVRKVRL